MHTYLFPQVPGAKATTYLRVPNTHTPSCLNNDDSSKIHSLYWVQDAASLTCHKWGLGILHPFFMLCAANTNSNYTIFILGARYYLIISCALFYLHSFLQSSHTQEAQDNIVLTQEAQGFNRTCYLVPFLFPLNAPLSDRAAPNQDAPPATHAKGFKITSPRARSRDWWPGPCSSRRYMSALSQHAAAT